MALHRMAGHDYRMDELTPQSPLFTEREGATSREHASKSPASRSCVAQYIAPFSEPSPAGANPIAARLADLRRRGRKAFAPFIMAGYPSLPATKELLSGLATAGADLIELGLPFSDPLADGPTNQEASFRALVNGATLDGVFALLAETAPALPCPIVLFTYLNPILQRGIEAFLDRAAGAGAAGLVVPDLPPDAIPGIGEHAATRRLAMTYLVAPTSSAARIALAAEASTGFLYAVSLKGVTGERRSLPPDLPEFAARVRACTGGPVLIGFGISAPEQARAASALADGVIVGSALVRLAGEKGVAAACELAGEIRAAVDGG